MENSVGWMLSGCRWIISVGVEFVLEMLERRETLAPGCFI